MDDPTSPSTSWLTTKLESFKLRWERIKNLYQPENRYAIERNLPFRAGLYTFAFGVALGYLKALPEGIKRFRDYQSGKKFLSPFDVARRRLDYFIVYGMRSGARVGFKLAFTPFMILLSTTHLTVFRNKFSAWYLPMTSALTCTVAAYPFGVTGWVQGFLFGATSGSLFASAIWLAAWYMERSTDGLYRLLKKEYEDNMQENIRVWKQNASQPKTLFGMKWAFHGKEINEIEADESEDDW